MKKHYYSVRYRIFHRNTALGEGLISLDMLVREPAAIITSLRECILSQLQQRKDLPAFDTLDIVSVSLLHSEDVPRGTESTLPDAVRRFLAALDAFNLLSSSTGGGWSTKPAGSYAERVAASEQLRDARRALEALL